MTPKKADQPAHEQVRTHLPDPKTGEQIPVRDVRPRIDEITRRNPPSKVEDDAMVERRDARHSGLGTMSADWSGRPLPPPGGVGAGFMLLDGQLPFSVSTGAYYYIIAPSRLGDASHALLYVTTSNRAAMGTESLVAYESSQNAVFRIWDWASPKQPNGSQFVVGLPRNDWGDYVIPYSIGGLDVDALYVVNITRVLDQGQWQNEVYLHNHVAGTRDLVWQFAFSWQPDEVHKYFDWGPILETFRGGYGNTQPVGFSEFLLVQDDIPRTLTPANAYVRSDDDQFARLVEVDFVDLIGQGHVALASVSTSE